MNTDYEFVHGMSKRRKLRVAIRISVDTIAPFIGVWLAIAHYNMHKQKSEIAT